MNSSISCWLDTRPLNEVKRAAHRARAREREAGRMVEYQVCSPVSTDE